MAIKETLDIFNLWCPICGSKLIEKIINDYKFIYCEDVLNCEYYKVTKIDPHSSDLQKDENIYRKFKKFIDQEKKISKNSLDTSNTSEMKNNPDSIYVVTSDKNTNKNKLSYSKLDNNKIAKDKLVNHKTDKNDINLIMDLLEKNKKDKSKIEIYREESRYKKTLQKK